MGRQIGTGRQNRSPGYDSDLGGGPEEMGPL